MKKLKLQLDKLNTEELSHIRGYVSGLLSARSYENLTQEEMSERMRCVRAGGTWVNDKKVCLGVAFSENIKKNK